MEKIGLCNRTKKRRINDEMLAYSSSQTSNYNINNSSSEDDLKKSLRKLPIQNNSLKLSNDINNLNNDSDNTFFIYRIYVINGLKRLAKKTLTATVRQMLRKLFDDELLQLYSYVGQKKKKIFSSLASCSVIFEAVRKIKAFENSTNIDIESPLKVYIAGSAFRKKKE